MRKVKFYLAEVPGMMKDKNNEELWKIRNGQFHIWGTESTNDKNQLPITVGIIEEEESGKIFSVIPQNITFVFE